MEKKPSQNRIDSKKFCEKEKFPSPLRQRFKSNEKSDLLYLNWPTDQPGVYRREYLGTWSDDTMAEYERRKRLFSLRDSGYETIRDRIADPTIADLASAFMEWAQNHYIKFHPEDGKTRPTGSSEKYFYAIRPLVELFGVEPVKEFSFSKLETIQNEIDRSKRFCRSGVNECISRIKTVFRWGKRRKIVPPSVSIDISDLPELQRGRCLSVDRKKITSVPRSVVEKTIPYLSPTVADMVRLQLLTACRPEEIRIMRRCDIVPSLEDNRIWPYTPPSYKTEHTRGSEDRIIPLGPDAQKIIQVRTCSLDPKSNEFIFRPVDSILEWRHHRAENRKTKQSPSAKESAKKRRLNPKEKLTPYFKKDAYARAIARAAKKAGVGHWTPYQLRHTAATEIEKKYGWLAAQVILGHSSPDTTRIYIDRDRSIAEKIAMEIG